MNDRKCRKSLEGDVDEGNAYGTEWEARILGFYLGKSAFNILFSSLV
jgi:hypothetical protein